MIMDERRMTSPMASNKNNLSFYIIVYNTYDGLIACCIIYVEPIQVIHFAVLTVLKYVFIQGVS